MSAVKNSQITSRDSEQERPVRVRGAAAASASAAALAATREARSLRRADALVASGQVDKALEQLQRLLKAVPGSTRASLKMASLLRETHRAGEAQEVLKTAIRRAPRDPAPREALAELCLEVGHLDEAIRYSRALLELVPRSLFARDVLSAAYLQRGLLEEALRVTDEMIRLDPRDPANHFKRGVLLQQKGQIGGAVKAFLRVLEMLGNNSTGASGGNGLSGSDDEIADEARAALEILDNYQIRQIMTLAMENVPFRMQLLRNPSEAVAAKGYLLSQAGLAALARVGFDDLPEAPPGWRHYHYH